MTTTTKTKSKPMKLKTPEKPAESKPEAEKPDGDRSSENQVKPLLVLTWPNKVTPSLNLWQGMKGVEQHKLKMTYRKEIAEKFKKSGAEFPRPDQNTRRVVVLRLWTGHQERDRSNILGPANKLITDNLQATHTKKVPDPKGGKTAKGNPKKVNKKVPGVCPVIYDDSPAHCHEIVIANTGAPRMIVEVWELSDWNHHANKNSLETAPLTVPDLNKDDAAAKKKKSKEFKGLAKRLPKCRVEPELGFEGGPNPLDVVELHKDLDKKGLRWIVVARERKNDTPDELAVIPLGAGETKALVITADDVAKLELWVNLEKPEVEMCRKIWEGWMVAERPIKTTDANREEQLRRLYELRNEAKEAEAALEAKKAEQKTAKKVVDDLAGAMGKHVDAMEASKWPYDCE